MGLLDAFALGPEKTFRDVPASKKGSAIVSPGRLVSHNRPESFPVRKRWGNPRSRSARTTPWPSEKPTRIIWSASTPTTTTGRGLIKGWETRRWRDNRQPRPPARWSAMGGCVGSWGPTAALPSAALIDHPITEEAAVGALPRPRLTHPAASRDGLLATLFPRGLTSVDGHGEALGLLPTAPGSAVTPRGSATLPLPKSRCRPGLSRLGQLF